MPWDQHAARELLACALRFILTLIYIYNGRAVHDQTLHRLVDTLIPAGHGPVPHDLAVVPQAAAQRNPNHVIRQLNDRTPLRLYDNNAPPHEPYYAVRVGRQPGIYRSWITTGQQTDGFPGAIHQRFSRQQDAIDYMQR